MATVKHHKVVAALPAELEPDALYLVRRGEGFDLYVTNHSGVIVPYPLNAPSAAASFFGLVTVTASATGQAEFAIPGGYTPGAIVVFLNGASLAPAHYTATDGAAVVLASGVGVVPGAELVVLRLSAFEVADALPLGGTAADSSKLGGALAAAFYQRGNILGVVSQLDGVPTGAIQQVIVTASGVTFRFAGGMQVCVRPSIDVTFISSGRLEATWLYPSEFSSGQVSAFVAMTGALDFAKCQGLPRALTNSTSATVGFRSPSGTFATGDVTQVCVIAIGRWFE